VINASDNHIFQCFAIASDVCYVRKRLNLHIPLGDQNILAKNLAESEAFEDGRCNPIVTLKI
jgi:hypothetical protein